MPRSDPRAYLKLLWRWKVVFLLLVVAVPAAAYFVVSRQTRMYQSSVLIQETPLKVDTSLFNGNGTPAPVTNASPQVLGGEARIIETPLVARLASRHLTPVPANPNTLLSHIHATPSTNTGFITVTATSPNPQRAADVANAFGAAVIDLRALQADKLLTTTIDGIAAQLRRLPKNDKTGQTQLSGQLQQLRALRAAQSFDAQILQAAVPSRSPVSPKKSRVVILGLIAGLLLGLGGVSLAEAADRRVRQPNDLEELAGLPLLAVIPQTAFAKRPRRDQRSDEAFHMLRSALMFFNVDRPVRSVLIASAVKDEGKTTVATQLAVAVARAGRSVVLVDADLRRPQAASRLGADIGPDNGGLAALLSGQARLEDVLIDLPLEIGADDEPIEGIGGHLRLVPAGPPPPNPSELLASERMLEVMDELHVLGDLVVIDTNPLLSVSDSLPLFELVSIVILVARLGFTTKDAVWRFLKTAANTGGTVAGVVATGASRGLGAYGYGYGYGYYGYTSTAYRDKNGGLKWRGPLSRRSNHHAELGTPSSNGSAEGQTAGSESGGSAD